MKLERKQQRSYVAETVRTFLCRGAAFTRWTMGFFLPQYFSSAWFGPLKPFTGHIVSTREEFLQSLPFPNELALCSRFRSRWIIEGLISVALKWICEEVLCRACSWERLIHTRLTRISLIQTGQGSSSWPERWYSPENGFLKGSSGVCRPNGDAPGIFSDFPICGTLSGSSKILNEPKNPFKNYSCAWKTFSLGNIHASSENESQWIF